MNHAKKSSVRFIALAAVSTILSGCAVDNFDFSKNRSEDGLVRAELLARELVQKKESGDENSLYDVSYFPLAHFDLHTFSEESDRGYPGGHVEADIEAYLPLASFLDMKITRYDENHKPYEKHEYDSYLWGLFATHKESIDTTRGLRKRSSFRLLWLLWFGGAPHYVEGE